MSDEAKHQFFRFVKVETGEGVEVFSPSKLVWHVKTGNEIPIRRITGEIDYEEETISYPWEKFIELYRPASPEATSFIKKCLEEILEAYQAKIYKTQEFLASL